MRQLQNDPENQVFLPRTIAQVCRLTVHLLMDRLSVAPEAKQISDRGGVPGSRSTSI